MAQAAGNGWDSPKPSAKKVEKTDKHTEFSDVDFESKGDLAQSPNKNTNNVEDNPETEEDSEPTIKEFGGRCSLTKDQKRLGFGITLGLGVLCTIIALFLMNIVKIVPFGIFYCVGNILFIISTCFIIGPKTQLKEMFKKQRILSTLIFFTTLILVIAVTIFLRKNLLKLLILPLVVVQFCAVIWYVLSYAPRAQECVRNVCGICFRTAGSPQRAPVERVERGPPEV
eukprot:TRINITY_DN1612_c0_g1_i2.p1 TRINITY_DN1612_c0_g1~~TRINITY_DN1612_c0_g1_i2.p1  ORF type:complete len:227 (+),score=26.39 TRINITY_DN1612_c0_g1_i2:68-748(+)